MDLSLVLVLIDLLRRLMDVVMTVWALGSNALESLLTMFLTSDPSHLVYRAAKKV